MDSSATARLESILFLPARPLSLCGNRQVRLSDVLMLCSAYACAVLVKGIDTKIVQIVAGNQHALALADTG
jgi:hypothetical protein